MGVMRTFVSPEHGGLGHDEGEGEGGERDEGAEGGQLPPAPMEPQADHQHRAHTPGTEELSTRAER